MFDLAISLILLVEPSFYSSTLQSRVLRLHRVVDMLMLSMQLADGQCN